MSTAVERTNFVGKNVPAEVKLLIKLSRKMEIKKFQEIVSVAFKMLSLKNPTHVDFHELTSNMDRDFIGKLYPGILTICQRALRLPLKKLKRVDFEHDLKEINMPEKCIEAFATVLFGDERSLLDNVLSQDQPRFPTVDDFRWRIDVSISTTSLKRVLEPSILCQIKTSDEQDCTFEVTKEKFHELRYAVSEVLNHMQQLEKRSILNI